jgi:hypothetical protein
LKHDSSIWHLRILAGDRTFAKIFVHETNTFHTDAHYRALMRELSYLHVLGPVVALTATCSPTTIRDIAENLFDLFGVAPLDPQDNGGMIEEVWLN